MPRAHRIGKARADWDVSHGNQYGWSEDNLRKAEKGWIRTADTVAGPAALIGLARDALGATRDRFNGFATTGNDPEDLLSFEGSPKAAP